MIEIKTSNVLLDEFLSLKRIPQKEDFLPILALPREELIADLEKVLADIIDKAITDNEDEVYNENPGLTALSCVFLLTELKSAESMPLYFRLFSLKNDVLDYYFSLHVYETLWLTLFEIGDIDAIFDFLKKIDDIDSIGAGIAIDSLTEMALYYPDLNQRIKKDFIDLYTYLHENNKDFRLGIDDLNLLFIRKLDFEEFESVLKMFYDSGRMGHIDEIDEVEDFDIIFGDLKMFQENFSLGMMTMPSLEEKYNNSATEEMLLDLESSFARLMHTASSFVNGANIGKKFEKIQNQKVFHSDYTPYVKTTPTIGRNEPCPCGSGKKYKKCCEK